jgi:hypothetical protein
MTVWVVLNIHGFTSFFYIVSFSKTWPPVKPGGSPLTSINNIFVKESAPGHFLLLFLISGTCRGLSLPGVRTGMIDMLEDE